MPGNGQYPGGTPCRYYSRSRSGVAAVTFRSPGAVWSEYHTLLCPFWLGTQSGAPSWYSLKDTAYEGDSNPAVRQTIDRWSNTVRALTIYHETAHWQDVSWPTCDNVDKDGNPEVYAAEKIVSLARNGGTKGYERNLRNAHSWTLAATAMWMMKRWPDISVPQPRRPIPATVDTLDEEPEEGWVDALDIGCEFFVFPKSLRGSIRLNGSATPRDYDGIVCSQKTVSAFGIFFSLSLLSLSWRLTRSTTFVLIVTASRSWQIHS